MGTKSAEFPVIDGPGDWKLFIEGVANLEEVSFTLKGLGVVVVRGTIVAIALERGPLPGELLRKITLEVRGMCQVPDEYAHFFQQYPVIVTISGYDCRTRKGTAHFGP